MRRLITVEQLILDARADGLEPDQIYIDPDDAVEIPELEEEE